MMGTTGFWSGETLSTRLPALIAPFDKDRIDCSAYTLSMGREIYVSPSDQSEDPESVTIRKLADGDAFTIPSGQFAFLLTEEIVEVPDDALGFISIKAKIKIGRAQSELQSLMRISYAVFCLKKKKTMNTNIYTV